MNYPYNPGAYTVIIVRADGSDLQIESAIPKERAEALKAALHGFFPNVLIVDTQSSTKSAIRPNPE
jgi:DNA-binding transcriptional regulator LsrR (DeoR family)